MSVEKQITAQYVKDDMLLESGFDLQRKASWKVFATRWGCQKISACDSARFPSRMFRAADDTDDCKYDTLLSVLWTTPS